MGDRLIRGGIAGLLGQVAIMAVNFPSKLLFHFSKHLWAEYGSVLVFGHPPKGLPETLVAFLAIFIFAAAVGAGFSAMMVLFPDRRNYVLRGVGWAYAVWLWTFIVGNIYRMPLYGTMDWRTASTQFLAITVFGSLVGTLIKVWDKAYGYPTAVIAGGGSRPETPNRAAHRLAFQESSAELGSVGDKLDAVAGRLDLIVERLEGLPGRDWLGAPPEGDTPAEDGWEKVEHLGFRRLQSDEEPDRK